ncbi:MAG: hypothetical protein WC994_03620 [Brumimicrobium sp.]
MSKINLRSRKVFFSLSLSMLIFFGFSTRSNAQLGDDFQNAIGVRLGSPIGVTYKHFFANNHALEAQFGYAWPYGHGYGPGYYNYGYNYAYYWQGMDIAALYEYHQNITAGFNWFAGGGIVVQIFPRHPAVHVGPALIGGVTYKFDFPLEVSVDYRPTFLFGSGGFAGSRGFSFAAASARYTF